MITDEFTGGACYSSGLGRTGGQQTISCEITNRNTTAVLGRSLIHEFGHVLGLYHEHQRPDRDDHVVALYNPLCAIVGCLVNHGIINDFNAVPIGSYDCTSRMHYGETSYSPLAGGCVKVGRDLANLSPYDLDSVHFLYPKKTTLTSNWNSGWMATRFRLSNRYFCFWFLPSTGQTVVSLLNDAYGETFLSSGSWNGSVSHLFSGRDAFGPIIIRYDSSTGHLHSYRVSGGTTNPTLNFNWFGSLGAGWTHFSPFTISGQFFFLAYSSSSGNASIYRYNSNGSISSVWQAPYNWDVDWTNFDWFDGVYAGVASPHLLAYKSSSGRLSYTRIDYSVDSQGQVSFPVNPWVYVSDTMTSSGWTSYLTFKYSDDHFLFTVNKNSNNVNFKIFNIGRGYDWRLIGETTWIGGWDNFIPFADPTSGTFNFVAFNSLSGAAEFGRIYAR